jgi:hypothetical protein
MNHRLPLVRRLTGMLALPEVLPAPGDPPQGAAGRARIRRNPSVERARLEAEMRRHWWL